MRLIVFLSDSADISLIVAVVNKPVFSRRRGDAQTPRSLSASSRSSWRLGQESSADGSIRLRTAAKATDPRLISLWACMLLLRATRAEQQRLTREFIPLHRAVARKMCVWPEGVCVATDYILFTSLLNIFQNLQLVFGLIVLPGADAFISVSKPPGRDLKLAAEQKSIVVVTLLSSMSVTVTVHLWKVCELTVWCLQKL